MERPRTQDTETKTETNGRPNTQGFLLHACIMSWTLFRHASDIDNVECDAAGPRLRGHDA